MWLLEKYRLPFVHLGIKKHHFQRDYQIACVAVMVWEKHLDQLTAAARDAFIALDYEIHDNGADVYALRCDAVKEITPGTIYCELSHALNSHLKTDSRTIGEG